MNEVAQKATLSGLRDLTINILCNSLHALSHSPGRGAVSGSALFNENYHVTSLHTTTETTYKYTS